MAVRLGGYRDWCHPRNWWEDHKKTERVLWPNVVKSSSFVTHLVLPGSHLRLTKLLPTKRMALPSCKWVGGRLDHRCCMDGPTVAYYRSHHKETGPNNRPFKRKLNMSTEVKRLYTWRCVPTWREQKKGKTRLWIWKLELIERHFH